MSSQQETVSAAAQAVVIALAHLRAIREQTADLESLLIGLDRLPHSTEAETLRSLFRIDARLGELVQIMGEAGPLEEQP